MSVLSPSLRFYYDILSKHEIDDVQVGKVGDLFLVNLVEDYSTGITENACGASHDFKEAFGKAVSELIERRVRKRFFSKLSSDGFAAFPKSIKLSESFVQNAARSEAIERHAWAEWWDECKAAEVSVVPYSLLKGRGFSVFKEIESEHKIEKVLLIRPRINAQYDLHIYLLKLQDEGYLSGGACGRLGKKHGVVERALIELYRHSIVYKRIKESDFSKLSSYEKRLHYFASGKGNDLVRQRLDCSASSDSIKIPEFERDEFVEHDDDDSHFVYVAKLKGQREFLSNDYKRFCL